MSILDVFRLGEIKRQLRTVSQERDVLRETLSETDKMDYQQLKEAIQNLEAAKLSLEIEGAAARQAQETERAALVNDLKNIRALIEERKKDIVVLDEEELLQSFGFYKPRYDLKNSDEYKVRLENVRARQKAMVKDGVAAVGSTDWTLNNSKAEGRKMIKDYVKLILRSFNNECDASIVKVKFNNIESIEQKLRKAYEVLNRLGQRMHIEISSKYMELKIEELRLCYEYEVRKQEEKEEQKRLREQMREEARVQREIEEMKQKLEKEEKHFTKALSQLLRRLEEVETDAERELLRQEQGKIETSLAELGKSKEEVLWREQNTRAGYVYVISNIGSFGENVFKIGVTRRLDPEERVDELGDASVPFDFDIHAFIFSDDAPKLEGALHKAFAARRLNKVNLRREFFSVGLGEIEAVVRENFSKPVQFTRLAEAAQYRQSLVLSGPKGAGAETAELDAAAV